MYNRPSLTLFILFILAILPIHLIHLILFILPDRRHVPGWLHPSAGGQMGPRGIKCKGA
jgi:hypothetical protein